MFKPLGYFSRVECDRRRLLKAVKKEYEMLRREWLVAGKTLWDKTLSDKVFADKDATIDK